MYCETALSGKFHCLVKGAKCMECADYRESLKGKS